jgi:putative PEP-CTERM system integral membrane protein
MPCTLATLYMDSGYQTWKNFSDRYGRDRAILGSGSVVTAWLVLFLAFQQQPQVEAFKLLERSPETNQIRQELLASSDVIRDGLLNAYLASYRYLSTTEANNHIREMYRHVLRFNDSGAKFVQDRYNQLMSPFLYKGSRSDSEKAAKLYGEFFDTPIQKGERKSILKAVKSTFNVEEAKAGVLSINEHLALIVKQEINIQEHLDWADVELHEVYENQTTEDEEIFYYFSLPESAVITGLWLGETESKSDRYPFQVSPRGAAQQVYNEQVRRQVDPALLEQVGPRHYRLRVYPIPARRTISRNPRKQHLWLTYKVMQENGVWPLPRLAEKRNVFWNYRTQRIYNGQKVKSWMNGWLPKSLPASQKIFRPVHQVSLPGNYQLSAKPLNAEDYTLPQGQRFAVILDRSYSMKAHGQEVSRTIDWLKSQGFADDSLANNDADIFLTASAGSKPERLDNFREFNPEKITFYGTLQYPEMLQQFEALRGTTAYDAILLVTDGGTYELADDKVDKISLSAPLWMIHLGEFPRAYDDATLQAIQASSGGVGTDSSQVLQRVATQAKFSDVTVVDGSAWFVENPNQAEIASIQSALSSLDESDLNGFEPLAARQLILSLTKEMQGNQLAELDAVHAIAKRFKIVSPYSSMIVLVNEQQKEALKEAEAKSDRFDREVEKGNEQLTKPNDMMSVAVPEPSTWLASLVAIVFLIIGKRKFRKSAH